MKMMTLEDTSLFPITYWVSKYLVVSNYEGIGYDCWSSIGRGGGHYDLRYLENISILRSCFSRGLDKDNINLHGVV